MLLRNTQRIARNLVRIQSSKPRYAFSVTTPIDLNAQQNDQKIKYEPIDPSI
jgi:hypothetical protein